MLEYKWCQCLQASKVQTVLRQKSPIFLVYTCIKPIILSYFLTGLYWYDDHILVFIFLKLVAQSCM